MTLLAGVNLFLTRNERGGIYISPSIGYGLLSEKKVSPSFGPVVTWTSRSEFCYGIRVGIRTRLRQPDLFFTAECLRLSMNMRLRESLQNRVLNGSFGPFGILLGISRAIH